MHLECVNAHDKYINLLYELAIRFKLLTSFTQANLIFGSILTVRKNKKLKVSV